VLTVTLHAVAAAVPRARPHLHLVPHVAHEASRPLDILAIAGLILVVVLFRTAIRVARRVADIASAYMQVAAEMTGLLFTVLIVVVLAVVFVAHR
jgi:hypothetical protein